MVAILQTSFSKSFSYMKIIWFWFKFHVNLFSWIQLTISRHWFRHWHGAEQAASHCLNQWRSSLLTHIGVIRCDHDDVIKWKHFPRYWPFVRGIHRSPVNSPHKGQWRGALMFSLICVWINGWVNNRKAGDLRRYRVHFDVTVMDELIVSPSTLSTQTPDAWMLP